MKNYIKKVTMTNKNGENIIFEDLTLNKDGVLEFTNSNIYELLNISYLYDEKEKLLKITGLSEEIAVKLPKQSIVKIEKFKKEILSDLNKLYKSIISGKEKLICFPLNKKNSDYLYIVTTKTILKKRRYSSKYIDSLIYVFSDECLKKEGINKRFNIESYKDLQEKIGEAISKLKLKTTNYNGKKVVITTFKEVIKGIS